VLQCSPVILILQHKLFYSVKGLRGQHSLKVLDITLNKSQCLRRFSKIVLQFSSEGTQQPRGPWYHSYSQPRARQDSSEQITAFCKPCVYSSPNILLLFMYQLNVRGDTAASRSLISLLLTTPSSTR
jgi:hypothetical protein